jgi:regulator of sigma E protease
LGFELIAFTLWSAKGLLIVAEVALALGMVIFVHELGHFAVAKACGVKCEKFYLGFDIYGLKLASFQRGETEYGIGILPLGGYVKMLGQDDNPSRAAEERERSQLGGESEALDPRSYMAQSVPKRMAIISAGVVMNLIFAYMMASAAYVLGVREIPCIIGGVVPGEAAWSAGLHTGMHIVQIGDLQNPRFRDLQSGVILSGGKVKFVVQEPGSKETHTVYIVPDQIRGAPTIGVTSPLTTKLSPKPLAPSWPKSVSEQIQPGDTIVAAAGKPVKTYAELKKAFTFHRDAVELGIVRKAKEDGSQEQLTIEIPPRPYQHLDLVMAMGPITAVQADSPAEAAGIKVGDVLTAVDGKPVGDPLMLPTQLSDKPGETVKLSLERGKESVEISVKQATDFSYESSYFDGTPVAVPSLGVTYSIVNRVVKVGGSIADGVSPGDEITAVKVIPGKYPEDEEGESTPSKPIDIEMGAKDNWPFLSYALQELPPGTKVELTLASKKTTTLEPVAAEDWFNPDRGFRFEPETYIRTAHGVVDDLALAVRETKESVTQVYGFLGQLFSGRISVKNLGGPITIAKMAGTSASEGMSELLRFLVTLSANLAVLNFLPIPLLDGGHMVFLLLEGIRGKPVSEKVVVAFHYAGFAFIIGLMLYVFSLDIQRTFF